MNVTTSHSAAVLGSRRGPQLGRIGIWSLALRYGEPGQIVEAAAELEALGFGTLWIPGVSGGELLKDVDRLLSATQRIAVATGILNVWAHEAHDVGVWWHHLSVDQKTRLLLGLGVSHSLIVGEAYRQPLTVMNDYLGRLSAEGIPADNLCLAALGPKMLALARDRTVGAHPYLVTPAHTAMARAILGSGVFLAPEQGVVLETDVSRGRDIARPHVKGYGQLANYANSWKRMGFSQKQIDDTSDELIDALFACGPAEMIAKRVNAHLEAGADHVCLQVVGNSPINDVAAIRPAWRELSATFL
jgi:probable F420-dependent oxidoreductase